MKRIYHQEDGTASFWWYNAGMTLEKMITARRKTAWAKAAGAEYAETAARTETLEQVMVDKKKRRLFKRLLDSYDADTVLVDEIDRKNSEGEVFTDEEKKHLVKRLYEFTERMALAEEAQKLFNPGEIEHIASGHDLLHAILMQNASAAELMREHITVLAMEHPDALREIMARKQEVDKKKETQRYGAYDRITDKTLARYRISAEEFGAIQNLSDEDARKERFHEMVGEKMTRFEKATAFMAGMYSKEATAHAYDTLDRFQKDILIKQIEEHQQAIAGVLAPLLRGDRDFMLSLRRPHIRKKIEEKEKAVPRERTWGDVGRDALVATAKTAGGAAADQYGLWKGMLSGLAGGVAKVAIGGSPQGAPAGGEKKEKPAKKEEKKETKPEEENLDDVEQYENPNELFERFSQLLGEDVEDARKLLKKNLVTNEQSEADDKKIFALIKKGKKDDARNLLKKRLKIPDAEEENK